jgi:hypothetical protein
MSWNRDNSLHKQTINSLRIEIDALQDEILEVRKENAVLRRRLREGHLVLQESVSPACLGLSLRTQRTPPSTYLNWCSPQDTPSINSSSRSQPCNNSATPSPSPHPTHSSTSANPVTVHRWE